ncbi:DUF11 domain-containing protein [Candidatus Woesearchaeota archaeon]|nr:DUF11 domain-containing protein [Candidatus Woesearchaeota archaeon]
MKQKHRFLLLMVLLLIAFTVLPIVHAVVIHDDYHKASGNFTVRSMFIKTWLDGKNRLNMLVDGFPYLLEAEQCATDATYSYCFLSKDDREDGAYVKIQIAERGPAVTVERSFDKDEVKTTEKITVTVTIKNTGDAASSQVTYIDVYPTTYGVIPGQGPESYGNGVKWSGSLDAGSEITMTYSITPSAYQDYESKPTLTYSSNGNELPVPVPARKISIIKPYQIQTGINPRIADTYKTVRYSINISSPLDKLMVSQLTIPLPKDVSYLGASPNLQANNFIFTYTGTIDKGSSEEFWIEFRATKRGSATVVADASFTLGRQSFTSHDEEKVTFSQSGVIVTIAPEKTIVKAGQLFHLNITLENGGQDDIIGLAYSLRGDYITDAGQSIALGSKQHQVIFNERVSAPVVEQTKQTFVSVEGSYKTADGKTLNFAETKQIQVDPQEKLLDITTTVDPPFERGKNSTVTVKAKSLVAYQLKDINLLDTIPSGMRRMAGEPFADKATFSSLESRQIYSYVLFVPATYTKDDAGLETAINMQLNGEAYISGAVQKFPVIGEKKAAPPKQQNQTAGANTTVILEENKSTNPPPKQEQDKVGFFGGIWNWIVDTVVFWK